MSRFREEVSPFIEQTEDLRHTINVKLRLTNPREDLVEFTQSMSAMLALSDGMPLDPEEETHKRRLQEQLDLLHSWVSNRRTRKNLLENNEFVRFARTFSHELQQLNKAIDAQQQVVAATEEHQQLTDQLDLMRFEGTAKQQIVKFQALLSKEIIHAFTKQERRKKADGKCKVNIGFQEIIHQKRRDIAAYVVPRLAYRHANQLTRILDDDKGLKRLAEDIVNRATKAINQQDEIRNDEATLSQLFLSGVINAKDSGKTLSVDKAINKKWKSGDLLKGDKPHYGPIRDMQDIDRTAALDKQCDGLHDLITSAGDKLARLREERNTQSQEAMDRLNPTRQTIRRTVNHQRLPEDATPDEIEASFVQNSQAIDRLLEGDITPQTGDQLIGILTTMHRNIASHLPEETNIPLQTVLEELSGLCTIAEDIHPTNLRAAVDNTRTLVASLYQLTYSTTQLSTLEDQQRTNEATIRNFRVIQSPIIAEKIAQFTTTCASLLQTTMVEAISKGDAQAAAEAIAIRYAQSLSYLDANDDKGLNYLAELTAQAISTHLLELTNPPKSTEETVTQALIAAKNGSIAKENLVTEHNPDTIAALNDFWQSSPTKLTDWNSRSALKTTKRRETKYGAITDQGQQFAYQTAVRELDQIAPQLDEIRIAHTEHQAQVETDVQSTLESLRICRTDEIAARLPSNETFSFFDAVKSNLLDDVRAYIESGNININQLNQNGHAALHIAALYGHSDMAQLLIEHGADVNIKATRGHEEGITPLHVASFHGNVEMVTQLKEAGASRKILSKSGHTAWDIAREQKVHNPENNHFAEIEAMTKPGRRARIGNAMKRWWQAPNNEKWSRIKIGTIELFTDFTELPQEEAATHLNTRTQNQFSMPQSLTPDPIANHTHRDRLENERSGQKRASQAIG